MALFDDAGNISRRSFLGWVAAGLGAAIAAVLGGSGLAYFLSPAFRHREEDWAEIGPTQSFLPGVPSKAEFVQRKRDAWVTVERRSSAWILTANGRDFTAFDPRCSHLGCPYNWNVQKKQFVCPCHAGVFDIDGNVVGGPPPRPLDRYPVKIMEGKLFILPKPEKEKVA